MSLKLLIDMNLSVDWIDEFAKNGYSAIHWSTVGDYRAKDTVIMEWALGVTNFSGADSGD